MISNFNDFINEDVWGSGENKDLNGEYIKSASDEYDYIGYNIFDMEEIWEYEQISIDEFLKYVSEETIKNMFPLYREVDFKISKDWHLKAFKNGEYLIFIKSGYDYTFKKQ